MAHTAIFIFGKKKSKYEQHFTYSTGNELEYKILTPDSAFLDC
jgi:hypothetical protein